MKITAVIPKEYTKDGETKHFWECAIQKTDGTTIGAKSFDAEPHVGDEITEDQLKPDGKGGFYLNTKKRGKGYQPRDENLMIAKDAVKLAVDLAVAGKIGVPLTEAVLTQHGTMIAKSILSVARAIKTQSMQSMQADPKSAGRPVDEFDREFPPREKTKLNSKQLFAKIKDAQIRLEECQQVPGFIEAVNTNDYDKAWDLIKVRIK